MLQESTPKTNLQITDLKFEWNLSGANELRPQINTKSMYLSTGFGGI